MDDNVSACIIEPDNRLFYVDMSFARQGVSEGWLKIDGWHREGPLDEVIVYRYRQIRRTVNY